jgi:hypothetical protein
MARDGDLGLDARDNAGERPNAVCELLRTRYALEQIAIP